MSKRRIKLTESDLKNIINESVKKVLKEDIYDIYHINRPKKGNKNKEDFGERFRHIRETISDLKDSLGVIRNFLGDVFYYAKQTYNPRISEDYIRGLRNTVNELEKAFSKDSPLMTSITNQVFNTWKKQKNDRKKIYSPLNGHKNINEKGQVTLYNPITKRVEGFTNQKAINVMKQMFNEPDDDYRRSWYVDGNMLAHSHGGVSVKKDELDDGSIYRPIDALALLVRDEKGEPEDWYERNEHGDFDTY